MVGSEKDIFETVKTIGPDVVALGYDQTHQEKSILDGCVKRTYRLSSKMFDRIVNRGWKKMSSCTTRANAS